jgi:hypothetical protein
MNLDNPPPSNFNSKVRTKSGPIGPGSDLTRSPGPVKAYNYHDRSGLILFLGILSLFMCGPLGIAAWIMAESDLRKIRKGFLSPEKIGILKVGRALGMTGTAIFVVVIVSGAVMLQRQFGELPGLFGYTPLEADQAAFAGEWFGKKGTVIRIYANGKADFRAPRASITGGRVSIKGESLSIRVLAFSRTWHIDTRPHMENGNWSMQLDGETFVRKSSEGVII